ncbi:hypothetical protein [Sporosarcina sp. P13]|uniref:hypothetical protein n=1 Tax=Sporosarcina sp. P13 TaxID=2048263 RepID=UPI0013047723|nr:hypothetical protein [Sporosarcina sp. P13]
MNPNIAVFIEFLKNGWDNRINEKVKLGRMQNKCKRQLVHHIADSQKFLFFV